MTKIACPTCHKTHSNSGKEFTAETLEMHRRDAHPENLMYPGLGELFGELEKHVFDDLVEVVISKPRMCDMAGCEKEAEYDAKTIFGPWGNLCQDHFDAIGIGLGTGKGQRLIVKEPTDG